MTSQRSLALCLLAGAVLLACHTSLAQETGDAAAVETLLERLRDTPDYERATVCTDIVGVGQAAVPQLMTEVEAFLREPDWSYTVHCIIALGELKAAEATDLMVLVLQEAPRRAHRYVAAWALGKIWGGRSPEPQVLRRVNAALVGAVYHAENTAGAGQAEGVWAVCGPALALIRKQVLGGYYGINDIRVEEYAIDFVTENVRRKSIIAMGRPNYLRPDELVRIITVWSLRHPEMFPPLEEQPWQMLVARAVWGGSPQARSEARDILVRTRHLAAVDAVLNHLRRHEHGLPAPIREELGNTLTALTGVAFPPPAPSDASGAELADLWMDGWMETLKTRKEQPFRRYALRRFQEAVIAVVQTGNAAARQDVDRFLRVLLSILDSPDDVHEDTVPQAAEYLRDRLAAKQAFVTEMEGLKKAEEFDEKLNCIQALSLVAASEEGREMGGLFAEELARFARKEQNKRILDALAVVMRDLTGVRVRLDQPSEEEKNRAIDQWLDQVKKRGAGGAQSP